MFKWIVNNPEKGEFVMQFRQKIGFMASDRMATVAMYLHKMDDGTVLYLMQSVEREDAPMDKGCVPMHYFKACHYIEADGALHATTFEQVDLGGYFPSSLLNMVIS